MVSGGAALLFHATLAALHVPSFSAVPDQLLLPGFFLLSQIQINQTKLGFYSGAPR